MSSRIYSLRSVSQSVSKCLQASVLSGSGPSTLSPRVVVAPNIASSPVYSSDSTLIPWASVTASAQVLYKLLSSLSHC